MSVFLDAAPLVAFANPGDSLHRDAVRLLGAVRRGDHGSPFTSDYVVAEALNFLRRRVRRRDVAEALLGVVFGRPGVTPAVREVFRVHGTVFAAALDGYRRRWKAGLSFTDWTTLALMEAHRIDALATFDAGFEPWVRVVR